MRGSTNPIAALRRAEAILRASGDPAGMAVGEALRVALSGAARLDTALGLSRHGGAGGMARVATLAQRDGLLRDLRRRFFVDLKSRPAARAVLALGSRRERAHGPASDDAAEMMDAILSLGALPGERHLARILDIQDPLWMS